MNILVIGATGYIGSHVAAALAGAGHQITVLERPGGAPSRDHPTVPGDLADPRTLTSAARGFDRVVHVGAPIDDRTDLGGAEALLAAGSPVIYTTGAAVLGEGRQNEDSAPNPHPIAVIRPEIERRVLAAGGWIIRPGLVYGDEGGGRGDGDGPGLVHGLLAGKTAERGSGVYIGDPGVRWPVVHVGDLAALYAAVVAAAPPGTVWHGISETVRLDAIAEALGGGTAASWPLDEVAREIGPQLADLFTRDQDVSAARTREKLGWTPVHTSIEAYLSRR